MFEYRTDSDEDKLIVSFFILSGYIVMWAWLAIGLHAYALIIGGALAFAYRLWRAA